MMFLYFWGVIWLQKAESVPAGRSRSWATGLASRCTLSSGRCRISKYRKAKYAYPYIYLYIYYHLTMANIRGYDVSSSGWILWKLFCGLDSDRYPVRGYGDFFFRLFGSGARHFINVAQAILLLLNVAVIILSNGQSISQISRGPSGESMGICFVACMLIFMALGFFLGQIRTLQRLGWLANLSVWVSIALVLLW